NEYDSLDNCGELSHNKRQREIEIKTCPPSWHGGQREALVAYLHNPLVNVKGIQIRKPIFHINVHNQRGWCFLLLLLKQNYCLYPFLVKIHTFFLFTLLRHIFHFHHLFVYKLQGMIGPYS
ncbi:hypothetical protein ACJX0J_033900, partial [Zea mays]